MQIKFDWPWVKTVPSVKIQTVFSDPIHAVQGYSIQPAYTISPSIPIPTAPKEAQIIMSFKSVLQTIGSDVAKVFAWIGSPKGQSIIATGETAVETIAPQLTGLINLANSGLAEIVKIEALAAGAAAQNGTGAQKLTAVIASTTPAILAYAEANGLPVPTAANIQNAVNGLVAFANALEGK